ncbi:MAG: aldehyde ferredoxin oxidoreductase family protein [Deltaproteobacteria bacterium]|nr:aldehyde ferredoxin oxidoreductase family protein [Deltaproteobacteria bacterium]
MHGFYGRILVVDLSRQRYVHESVDENVPAAFLGGKGLGSALLAERNPAGVDPFSPDNHLVFATGPACGTMVWGGSRYGVFTKSPQTGFYSESYAGGRVPEAMDAAGYDALVVTGRAPTPVVLVVRPEGAAFHKAGSLWGMDTYRAQDAALERFARQGHGKSGAVVIGPAGENQVCFSVIENDYWRSAGRTGAGAVMGSKNLKAIVFQGNRRRQPADTRAIKTLAVALSSTSRTNAQVAAYRTKGTPMMVEVMNRAGGFPTRYWREGSFEAWRQISAEALHTRCRVTPKTCAKCFIACGRLTTVEKGRHTGLRIEGPEYETIYAFGGLCAIESIEEIIYLNDLCDRLGMDTITAGNLCGLAIEAARRGRIDDEVDYGRPELVASLLKKIAFRQGVGDVLARGIRVAARHWNLEDIAVHVKGLEPAGYDPRVLKGVGLGYATSDRGACHLRATFYKPELSGMIDPQATEGKATLFVDYEDRLTLFDTLILCRFYRDLYPWETLCELVNALTGLKADEGILRSVSSRIADTVRRFNTQEGLRPEDDRLPERLYRESLKTGHHIEKAEMRRMIQEYYRLRGWDEHGRVRPRNTTPPA